MAANGYFIVHGNKIMIVNGCSFFYFNTEIASEMVFS